jgi:hypothetical protein
MTDDYDWQQLIERPEEPQQIDLDDQPHKIDPGPPAPTELDPPPVQLGLDVDVPVAMKRGGQVVAYQHPLGA